MLTPRVLIEQALEVAGGASPELSDAECYSVFDQDLREALGDAPLVEQSGFVPIERIVAPENRPLAAWAIMRYLGLGRGLPSSPGDLRPKTLSFIRSQIDLDVHRIKWKKRQSHDLERALSEVVPRIERDLKQATTLPSFDSLERFQRDLLAPLNGNANAPLLDAFMDRPLVADALKRSLAAAIAFRESDSPGLLEAYDRAREVCADARSI